jgi:hypothetical protein
MTTTSRPDRLPLAKAVRLGLPYHGLITNGVLATGGGNFTYPGGSDLSSSAIAVQHPGHSAAATMAGDDAKWSFQDYALLSGDAREIGGQELGAKHWLYCDAAKTWNCYYTITGNTENTTIKVYLGQRFGAFGDAIPFLAAPIELASLTFASTTYAGVAVTGLSVEGFSSHSLDGSVTAINVFSAGATAAVKWPFTVTSVFSGRQFDGYYCLHDVVKVVISGNGADDGAGITATIQHYQDATDLQLGYAETAYFYHLTPVAVSHAGALVQGERYYLHSTASESVTEDEIERLRTTEEFLCYGSFAGITVSLAGTYVTDFMPSSATIFVSGSLNGVPITPDDPEDPQGMAMSIAMFMTSHSIDLQVIEVAGSADNVAVLLKTAAGKQGHFQTLSSTWDGYDVDIAYDSMAGAITAGAVGEQVAYV